MHSQTERADVLDWHSPDSKGTAKLIHAICTIAAIQGWRPARIPLAASDPRTEIVRGLGFQSRWSFDMLARSISRGFDLASITNWTYAGINYI
jgi:hypothetical protein